MRRLGTVLMAVFCLSFGLGAALGTIFVVGSTGGYQPDAVPVVVATLLGTVFTEAGVLLFWNALAFDPKRGPGTRAVLRVARFAATLGATLAVLLWFLVASAFAFPLFALIAGLIALVGIPFHASAGSVAMITTFVAVLTFQFAYAWRTSGRPLSARAVRARAIVRASLEEIDIAVGDDSVRVALEDVEEVRAFADATEAGLFLAGLGRWPPIEGAGRTTGGRGRYVEEAFGRLRVAIQLLPTGRVLFLRVHDGVYAVTADDASIDETLRAVDAHRAARRWPLADLTRGARPI